MSLFSFLSSPVTLAAAAVIAIGVIVYEIVNHQKEERVPNRGGGRGPRNPGSDSWRSESSNSTSYDNLESNIRRRKREETEIKRSSMTNKVATNEKKLAKNEEKLAKNDEKLSNRKSEFDKKNYYQNVFDKIESDVKNINQADDKEKTFHKNIDDGVSDSSASSVSANINEPKLMNTNNSDANKKGIHLKKQTAPSKKSKMENIDNAREINPTNNNDPTYSGATSVNNKQNHTGSDDVNCMACEEKLANAVAHPCKHCYMCFDCAIIVHRIHKKCTICESEIDHFKLFEQ